jgi:hypothetical protein
MDHIFSNDIACTSSASQGLSSVHFDSILRVGFAFLECVMSNTAVRSLHRESDTGDSGSGIGLLGNDFLKHIALPVGLCRDAQDGSD